MSKKITAKNIREAVINIIYPEDNIFEDVKKEMKRAGKEVFKRMQKYYE